MDYETIYKRFDFDAMNHGPAIEWTNELFGKCKAAKDDALADGVAKCDSHDIEPWVFLEYLVKKQEYLLHGSQQKDIAVFEPRVAGNHFVDGQSPKVYASSSGILSMWYAIVDRQALRTYCGQEFYGMMYAPYDPRTEQWVERFFFNIGEEAYPHFPFSSGVVYVLPRDGFSPEYLNLQWYSEQPAKPLFCVPVSPEQWPMLKYVRAMNSLAAIKWMADPDNKIPAAGNTTVYPPIPEPAWKNQLRA